MWPDLGHVEDVPLVALGFLGRHDLNVDIPDGIVAPLNSLEQVVYQKVRVLARDSRSRLPIKVLDPKLGLDVNLDVVERSILRDAKLKKFVSWSHPRAKYTVGDRRTYLLGHLVSMSTECVHMAKRGRCSSVTEQVEELVNTFLIAHVEAKSNGIWSVNRILGTTVRIAWY